MKAISCCKCGKNLGTIEKAKIMKGVAYLCPEHAHNEDLKKAADAFAKNKSNHGGDDFMSIMKKMGLS